MDEEGQKQETKKKITVNCQSIMDFYDFQKKKKMFNSL